MSPAGLSASASASVTVGLALMTLLGSQGGGKGEIYQMHRQVGQRTLDGTCWLVAVSLLVECKMYLTYAGDCSYCDLLLIGLRLEI